MFQENSTKQYNREYYGKEELEGGRNIIHRVQRTGEECEEMKYSLMSNGRKTVIMQNRSVCGKTVLGTEDVRVKCNRVDWQRVKQHFRVNGR